MFQGPVRNACSLSRGPCHLETMCTVYGRLASAQQAFLDALDTHSIRSIGDEFLRLEEAGLDSRPRLGELRE